MEPLDYLRALWRRWLILVVAALIGAASAWLTAPAGASASSSSLRLRGGTYKATHNLIIDRQSVGTVKRSDRNADTTNLPLLALLATSGEVPLRVVERLGLESTPSAIAGKVDVEADEKLDTLQVSSTGSNPDEVAALADAFAAEILRLAAERNEVLRNEALTRAKGAAEGQQIRIRQLDARLLQLPPGSSESRLVTAEREALLKVYAEQQGVLQDLQSQPPASAGLVSLGPAVPVPSGSGEVARGKALQFTGDRPARTGFGLLLGLVVGCALALLVERVDTRVRGRREAEQAFGLPVLAELPGTRPLSTSATERGGASGVDPETADAYGRLALAVLHSPRWVLSPRPPSVANDDEEDGGAPVRLVEGPTRLVLVASPGHEEARAGVIANLAASLAASGRSVIAIECNPGRPRLAHLLGVPLTEGTEPASRGTVAGQLGVRRSAVRGVWVVITAASRGSGLAMDRQLMRSYLEWGDIVLVDAGPLLSGGEAGAWAVEADAVLIVTGIGRTTAETATLTREHLARLQARVLGVALVERVALTARRRSPGAPSLPLPPPPTISADTPTGTRDTPSPPPSLKREDPRGSFQSSDKSARASGFSAQRLRPGEAVSRGDGHLNGEAHASSSTRPPSPHAKSGERIAPVVEVLTPEPSAPGVNRPTRPRLHGERMSGDGPLRSVRPPP